MYIHIYGIRDHFPLFSSIHRGIAIGGHSYPPRRSSYKRADQHTGIISYIQFCDRMELATDSFAILAMILCGVLSIALYHARRLPLYRAAARFSGPPAMPIIGNAYLLAGNNEDILNKVLAMAKSYPKPARFWAGNRLIIYVNSAEHLKTILHSSKAMEKMYLYKVVRAAVGTGLLTAPASKWKDHRKMIAPTFNRSILESFVEIFARQSKIMVQKMEIEVDGHEFGVFSYLYPCALDIICESAIGVNINSQTDKDGKYLEMIERGYEIVFNRVYKIWLHPDIIFNSTRSGKIARESIEYLNITTNDVIYKMRVKMAERIAQSDTITDDDRPRRKPFLELLLELSDEESKLSDADIFDEVNTMILTGSDTTGTLLSFVILVLASHPEIQEKVYEELCDIYGQDDDGRTVAYEDMKRMEYMERVIKETMRIFPLVPFIGRDVTEDLEIGEHTIPKGSSVVLGIFEAHRSEEYWSDPLEFDPDRFLPEEIAKRHRYCYVPFSVGPRDCIGRRYAMLSMKVILTTILRRYILKKDIITPMKDIKLKVEITMKPIEPIKIRICDRTPKMNHS